jgi:hypothetical protein
LSAIKEGNYSIVSKVNSEILLQFETTEAEKGTASMYVILPLFLYELHAIG